MKRTSLAIAIGAISMGLAVGVLAEDVDVELNDDVTTNEEQAAEPSDTQEEGVSVSEEQLPDEGTETEDYEALDSDDETASSDNEETDSDDDTTDSGNETSNEADDATEAQTEPAAEQAEQAPEGEHTPQAGQDAERDTEAGFEEMEPTGAALDPSIASLQVSDVEGMTVVNAEGETLGQVENVLRHNDAGDLHAVVPVGGFWIFGGSDVALPLANMQLEGEKLVLQDIVGQDELDDFATGYDEERYSDVDDDMTLSDAMGR